MHLFCETDAAVQRWIRYGIGLTAHHRPRDDWRRILTSARR